MFPRIPLKTRAGAAFALGMGCFWFATAAGVAADSEAIPWRPDHDRAATEARTQGRLLWVQFSGPWCHWCTRLESETLIHPRIVEQARGAFVPIKLQSDVHEDLALRYGITGLPATVLVAPSGKVLAKHEGFLDADGFHAFLQTTLARSGLNAPRPAAPAREKPDALALAGYCPVSLVADRKLVAGQTEVSLKHGGKVYRFANESFRSLFQKQPERYIPVNGERCPVTQVDCGDAHPGDPHWGVLYDGHLYLCADEASRKHFVKQPARYAHVDVADRGFCPHCWTRDAVLVRGKPEYTLTRAGHRFFFPDASHLEAFRSASDTTRR